MGHLWNGKNLGIHGRGPVSSLLILPPIVGLTLAQGGIMWIPAGSSLEWNKWTRIMALA